MFLSCSLINKQFLLRAATFPSAYLIGAVSDDDTYVYRVRNICVQIKEILVKYTVLARTEKLNAANFIKKFLDSVYEYFLLHILPKPKWVYIERAWVVGGPPRMSTQVFSMRVLLTWLSMRVDFVIQQKGPTSLYTLKGIVKPQEDLISNPLSLRKTFLFLMDNYQSLLMDSQDPNQDSKYVSVPKLPSYFRPDRAGRSQCREPGSADAVVARSFTRINFRPSHLHYVRFDKFIFVLQQEDDNLPRKPAQAEVEIALISKEDLSGHAGWNNLDLDTRLTTIQQGVTMVDCHMSRTEVIALDVKYESSAVAVSTERDVDRGDTNKGKCPMGLAVTDGGMFDMVAPNSPSDDDIVILEERKVLPIEVGASSVVFSLGPGNNNQWPYGLSKVDSVGSDTLLPEQNLGNYVNTQTCGLYSSLDMFQRPNKAARLDNLEYSAIFNSPLQTLGGVSLTPAPKTATSVLHGARISAAGTSGRASRKRGSRPPPKPEPWTIIPATHFLYIRPSADMGLTKDECRIAAYVFAISKDYCKKEFLFRYKQIHVTREILVTLSLDYVLHSDVINIAALISSLQAAEGRNNDASCWFFPSSVAHKILTGKGVDDIMHFYTSSWMPKTSELEHVFIPVREDRVAWYMILLDVKNTKVYALDVNRSTTSLLMRDRDMRRILAVVGEVFQNERNISNIKRGSPDPNTWGQIEYPMGLPARLDPQDTAGLEEHVRMKAAMVIVASEFNELLDYVNEKSTDVSRGFPLHVALEMRPMLVSQTHEEAKRL
ncbi:hypothetical protein PIB30_047165 [Stylosanthes scabra]|uniref:Ubiquitin-like protease family profile domain-containing protein n=1 Tax=Stylosanthes scabra TaxID=79078 RepID=A0ABU6ZFD5_9FABA|nr:hypothetical protein [Stylosanthes scabra]